MGGVDLHDQLLQNYACRRKTNRWTYNFSINLIESLILISYFLYKQDNEKKHISHLDYQLFIVRFLCEEKTLKTMKKIENVGKVDIK